MSDASNLIFRQLNDADLKWGAIKNERGELVELSNASFSMFLQSPERSVRKKAFHEYYAQFTAHEIWPISSESVVAATSKPKKSCLGLPGT